MRGVRGEHATPGEFRRSQNWIGRPGCTLSEATYVPPTVSEMQKALDAFEKYLHAEDDEHHPLVRLALIHYQFEAIHPFLDGNGRIGRLLISLLLAHWNLLPLPLLYLSAYFEQHRDRYYGLLRAVSERSAWRDWVLFFLGGVQEQAGDASKRLKRLWDLRVDWRARLTRFRTSALPLALADELFRFPVLSIPRAQQILKVASYLSAQLSVRKLVEAGILRQAGESAYGKTYVAQEVIDAISDRGE